MTLIWEKCFFTAIIHVNSICEDECLIISFTRAIANVSWVISIHEAKWTIIDGYSNDTHVVCVQHPAAHAHVRVHVGYHWCNVYLLATD